MTPEFSVKFIDHVDYYSVGCSYKINFTILDCHFRRMEKGLYDLHKATQLTQDIAMGRNPEPLGMCKCYVFTFSVMIVHNCKFMHFGIGLFK